MNDPQKPPPNPLSQREKLNWLRLIRSDNVGPITFFKLLERFGTAGAALDALPDLAKRGGKRQFKACPQAAAESEMASLAAVGAQLIAYGEPDYPPLLAHLDGRPPLISVLGHTHLLKKACVSVVGSRNATIQGRNFARKLAQELGQGGMMVASGMARGIDRAAHEGALATGTTAVLGGGVDVVYPKENADLHDRLKAEAVIISECRPGHQPQARDFPRRNRIIAGLARGIVVVEASPRSGSLITARLALEANREVFAVPGAPGDPRTQGANRLIRDGAHLTECAADVLEILKSHFRPAASEPEPYTYQGGTPDQADPKDVDEAREWLLRDLGSGAVTVDELLRACQFSQAVVSTALLELELAGRIERHPGNRVSLIR